MHVYTFFFFFNPRSKITLTFYGIEETSKKIDCSFFDRQTFSKSISLIENIYTRFDFLPPLPLLMMTYLNDTHLQYLMVFRAIVTMIVLLPEKFNCWKN